MSYSTYSADPFPPVVKNLMIINALVYVAQLTLASDNFNLTEHIALYPVQSQQFAIYQVITNFFAHDPTSFFHILFNMFALWMFGRHLENVWGSKRFLFFYMACGLGATLCHIGVQYSIWENMIEAANAGNLEAADEYESKLAWVLGASGAVMGVMVAYAYLFPNTEIVVFPIPVPIKAKWLVIGLVAVDLFFGLGSFQGDTIGRFAHLGGALTGFIIVLIWNKTMKKRFY